MHLPESTSVGAHRMDAIHRDKRLPAHSDLIAYPKFTHGGNGRYSVVSVTAVVTLTRTQTCYAHKMPN
jgi:hypothetical protein